MLSPPTNTWFLFQHLQHPFILQSLVQLTTPLKNIPINSRLDFVLALMIAHISGPVTSLSLPKDRNQAWYFPRNTSVWHSSWNSGPQSSCDGIYESMNEWGSKQVHVCDRDLVQPGPATEPCQGSCLHDWGKAPPLGKATWSQGNGCHSQRESTGHFRKIQNRCDPATSLGVARKQLVCYKAGWLALRRRPKLRNGCVFSPFLNQPSTQLHQFLIQPSWKGKIWSQD